MGVIDIVWLGLTVLVVAAGLINLFRNGSSDFAENR